MNDKEIFAKNLKFYMNRDEKTRNDLCKDLGISYFTISDWVNAKKMPRMDKIQRLADYFGILKSELIEDKDLLEKNNDVIADIIHRMRVDQNFLDLCKRIYLLDDDRFKDVENLLNAFLK